MRLFALLAAVPATVLASTGGLRGEVTAETKQPAEPRRLFGPPWWILHKVTPGGPEKDHGSWKSISFSREQQTRFHVDQEGEILDEAKFNEAMLALPKERTVGVASPVAAQLRGAKIEILQTEPRPSGPPWWILHKVKPEGVEKDYGTWNSITFSEEQQKRFLVDEEGHVEDQEGFDRALQVMAEEREANARPEVEEGSFGRGVAVLEDKTQHSRRLMLPPWWILHKVEPGGPEKDHGTWTSISFSEEQQKRFAIDEEGTILDKEKFQSAMQVLAKEREARAKASGQRVEMLPQSMPMGNFV